MCQTGKRPQLWFRECTWEISHFEAFQMTTLMSNNWAIVLPKTITFQSVSVKFPRAKQMHSNQQSLTLWFLILGNKTREGIIRKQKWRVGVISWKDKHLLSILWNISIRSHGNKSDLCCLKLWVKHSKSINEFTSQMISSTMLFKLLHFIPDFTRKDI